MPLVLFTGHGGSDGLHAYVNSLDDAVTDAVRVLLLFSCSIELLCMCEMKYKGGKFYTDVTV